jgi:hypothetical protein
MRPEYPAATGGPQAKKRARAMRTPPQRRPAYPHSPRSWHGHPRSSWFSSIRNIFIVRRVMIAGRQLGHPPRAPARIIHHLSAPARRDTLPAPPFPDSVEPPATRNPLRSRIAKRVPLEPMRRDGVPSRSSRPRLPHGRPMDGTRRPSASEVEVRRRPTSGPARRQPATGLDEDVAGWSRRRGVHFGGVDGTRTRDLRRDRPAF